MDEEHLTDETQPSAADVQAEGGDEAGSPAPDQNKSATVESSLTLDEINSLLGKQYKDKDTALKSLKDMSSQAGKVADLLGRTEPKQEGDKDDRYRELEMEVFYARNPEHEANKNILEAFATQHKVSIKEAVELPEYKELSDKLKGAEEAKERRTVVDSNRRQPVSDEYQEDRKKAMETGDWGSFMVKHHLNVK